MMPLAHLVEPSPYQPIEIPEATTFPLQPRQHRKPGLKGRKTRRKKVKKPSTETQDTVIPLASISKTNEATNLPGRSSAGEETTALQTTLNPGPIKREGEILTARHPVVLTVEEAFSNETWQGERPISGPSAGHSQVSKPRPGLSQRCRCYQRLDHCPFQIGPNEFKYQLHNSDDRTLYHCNCTRRLARFLRRRKSPNEVEEQVLSHYIAPSCFVLENLPGCRMGGESWPNCIGIGKAILAPARHLTNRLMGKRARGSLKVKRQEGAFLEGPARLFDKCVRLVRAALQPAPR
ncbi:PREDICTED: group 3 secretory phospholipase A2 [Thamnophis sirtalis]|uniref:Group 3 secretory phospholipase A2 n=1 Tax=Thamnophis sirtalis TaxID=35019 RepID=A0A6I9XUR7_9SAUR|nr:PREDICTED: group 3 secretory phospholipase A2 [Thamnophis sirtalis]